MGTLSTVFVILPKTYDYFVIKSIFNQDYFMT